MSLAKVPSAVMQHLIDPLTFQTSQHKKAAIVKTLFDKVMVVALAIISVAFAIVGGPLIFYAYTAVLKAVRIKQANHEHPPRLPGPTSRVKPSSVTKPEITRDDFQTRLHAQFEDHDNSGAGSCLMRSLALAMNPHVIEMRKTDYARAKAEEDRLSLQVRKEIVDYMVEYDKKVKPNQKDSDGSATFNYRSVCNNCPLRKE